MLSPPLRELAARGAADSGAVGLFVDLPLASGAAGTL